MMDVILRVNRRELAESIAWFLVESGATDKIKRGLEAGRAAISYRRPFLAISAAGFGHRYEATAEGYWPGEAVVDASYLNQLSKSIHNAGDTHVRVVDGRFFLGDSAGVPCWWRTARAYLNSPNTDDELLRLLGIRLNTDDPKLVRMGLLEAVRSAEQRQAHLIAQAAKILEPLGIAYWDLYRAAESAAGVRSQFPHRLEEPPEATRR